MYIMQLTYSKESQYHAWFHDGNVAPVLPRHQTTLVPNETGLRHGKYLHVYVYLEGRRCIPPMCNEWWIDNDVLLNMQMWWWVPVSTMHDFMMRMWHQRCPISEQRSSLVMKVITSAGGGTMLGQRYDGYRRYARRGDRCEETGEVISETTHVLWPPHLTQSVTDHKHAC